MLEINLLFMAAGLSSRFGGEPKILCNVGPNNETIFEMNMIQMRNYISPKKIHLICNVKTCEKIMKEVTRVCEKYKISAEISYNIQETPSFREKPWGTADALASAHNHIDDSFILLNSDDLYGEHTFELISEKCNKKRNYIIGFKLGNTLINEEKANRGFISLDESNHINIIYETLSIEKVNYTENELNSQYVSVNLFLLQPEVLGKVSQLMDKFKEDMGRQFSCEAMLPNFINKLLYENSLELDLLMTDAKWCGVTFKEDIQLVKSILLASASTDLENGTKKKALHWFPFHNF
jgi:choline kinase